MCVFGFLHVYLLLSDNYEPNILDTRLIQEVKGYRTRKEVKGGQRYGTYLKKHSVWGKMTITVDYNWSIKMEYEFLWQIAHNFRNTVAYEIWGTSLFPMIPNSLVRLVFNLAFSNKWNFKNKNQNSKKSRKIYSKIPFHFLQTSRYCVPPFI